MGERAWGKNFGHGKILKTVVIFLCARAAGKKVLDFLRTEGLCRTVLAIPFIKPKSPPHVVRIPFPEYRSLCLAEICNQTQHNILTPRGAEVRDTLAWNEALNAMKRKWVDTGRVDSA